LASDNYLYYRRKFKMKRIKKTTLLVSMLGLLSPFIFLPFLVYGAVPQYISYQGKLLEDGEALSGTRSITFSIWDNDVGGNPASALWQETQNVSVMDGIFNVELGSVTPLPGTCTPMRTSSSSWT
jgi:hypothetical protein